MKPSDFLTELSTEKLAQYKTAATADASKADKEKDFARGNKRFSGIVQATKKQFANDVKKESVGIPYPGTYEETNDMFKSKGQRRTGTLTTEQDKAKDSEKECPPATQDIKLNLKNRQKAINEYGYGPLNPDMPNTKFWMKKVDEWNLDGVEEAQQSLCGNCAAFDQRQHTLDCIAQGIDNDNPKDAEGVINAGDIGYCKFLKFKCASRRTCDAWVTGGPLTDDEQGVTEGWSQKYKSSINCSHPKGFSQKAHCAGKKKHNESIEMEMTCPDCGMCQTHRGHENLDEACWKGYHKEGNKKMFGKTYPNCVKNESEEKQENCPHCNGPMFSEMIMNEKKDACYYKVKSRYKVWPSAYASGALVKCRKKGASNWGNSSKNESSILEGINQTDESLHDWFNKEKWVRMDTKGNIKGPCAREPGEGKPKCLPQAKAHSLGKKGRASAAARKRREDPNPDRSGKAINVNTKKTKG